MTIANAPAAPATTPTPDQLRPHLTGMLDIGSNAIKLAVCRLSDEGLCEPTMLEERITWFNQGLDEDGVASEEAVQRVLGAIGELLAVAHAHDAMVLGAVSTAAMRKAENRIEIMNRIKRTHGVRTRLLLGEEEAAAGYLSVYERLRREGRRDDNPLVTFDLGGRSAEMTVGYGPSPERYVSVELGSSQLNTVAPTSDPPVPSEIEHIRDLAKAQLKELKRPPRDADVALIGATATTLAGYVPMLFAKQYGPDPVTHLDRDMIRSLVIELSKMTLNQRRLLPGNPERAPIILHGAIALEQAFKYLGFREGLVVPDGVAFGATLSELRGVPLQFTPVTVKLPAIDFRPLTRHDRSGEVLFALRRADGHIYLQRKIDYPAGVYRLPGGGVDRGEASHLAFWRELKEETSCAAVRAQPVASIHYTGPDGSQLDFVSLLYLVDLEDQVPEPEDQDEGIEDYAPISPMDLPKWVDRLESLSGSMHPWGLFRGAALRVLMDHLERMPV